MARQGVIKHRNPLERPVKIDRLGRRHHKTTDTFGKNTICAIGSCQDKPASPKHRYCKAHEEQESKPLLIEDFTGNSKDVTEW
jgi:hypothetical protein